MPNFQAKTISFARNGKHFGTAFTLTADHLKKPFFPSVSSKNIKFLVSLTYTFNFLKVYFLFNFKRYII